MGEKSLLDRNDVKSAKGAGQASSAGQASPVTDRRTFLQGAAAGTAALAWPKWARGAAADDLAAIRAEIEKRHEESVKRLQDWIRQPSIAAENRGMNEGCELTMRMLRDSGFQKVTKVPTDGQPGIFATYDAARPRRSVCTSCTTSSRQIRRNGHPRRSRPLSLISRDSEKP